MAFTPPTAPQVRMDLKTAEFQQKLEQIKKQLGKEAGALVLKHSRQLVKKFAYYAPKDTGRLRAGFWPAAISLQMTSSIYTSYPNKGEGRGINRTQANNPSVTIVNSVPYVANAGGRGTGWWWKAMNAQMALMNKELDDTVRKAWKV